MRHGGLSEATSDTGALHRGSLETGEVASIGHAGRRAVPKPSQLGAKGRERRAGRGEGGTSTRMHYDNYNNNSSVPNCGRRGEGVDAATRRGGGARRVAARGEEPELPIS